MHVASRAVNGITLEDLAKIAVEKQVSITVTIEPDCETIEMSPWEPFHYACPYGRLQDN